MFQAFLISGVDENECIIREKTGQASELVWMPWRRKIILVLARNQTSAVQFVSQLWAETIFLH
jgi:hypothetical protein